MNTDSISALVDRIAAELGPEADPGDVESIARGILAGSDFPAQDAVVRGLLFVSLADCSSRLLSTVRSHAYDKIRRIGSHLSPLLESASAEAGVACGGFEIITSPLALAAPAADTSDFLALAADLNAAAEQCGAAEIHGFSAPAERHLSKSARRLLGAIPSALAANPRVQTALHCGSASYGINLDAVAAAASLLKSGTPGRRFSLACNASDLVPAGLDAGFAIALRAPREDLRRRTESAEQVGETCARQLAERSGLDVVFDGLRVEGAAHALLGGAVRRAHERVALSLAGDSSESEILSSALEALDRAAETNRPAFVHVFLGGLRGETVDLGPPFGRRIVA